jgi:hypothetical protein
MRFTNPELQDWGRFLLLDNCRFNFGLHQLKTYHWRIHKYWRDYQSIKVLGKVLLNEYMVPFEFASVLLLVMIGTVLLSKKKKNREIT